jgi:serine/threonine protein kinase
VNETETVPSLPSIFLVSWAVGYGAVCLVTIFNSVKMPQKLGNYDVYGTLGKGKFSRIRFAVNRLTHASYAIKIIDKAKLKDNGSLDDVKNEIAIVKTIDCKYCVAIKDMFANTEKIFLVIDLMMGGSLMQRLRKRGKLSEERTRFYVQQVFLGVEYCHKIGVVVGGLSLEGILLDRENNVKISDFGYSTLESCAQPTCTGNRSLPEYLSPELVNEVYHVSVSSDIWALAVIVYTLAAGFMPFGSTNGLPELYRKILAGAYETFPVWFTPELCGMLGAVFQMDGAQRPSLSVLRGQPWMKWDTTDFGVEADDDDDEEEDGISRATNGNERVRPTAPDAPDTAPAYACLNIIPDVFGLLWVPMDYLNIPNPMNPKKPTMSPLSQHTPPVNGSMSKKQHKKKTAGERDAYTYDPSEFSAAEFGAAEAPASKNF